MKRNKIFSGRPALLTLVVCALFFTVNGDVFAQKSIEPDNLKVMKWRSIGPFRGGRVTAVAGVVGDRNTYYFGGVGGGVWKTTNGGNEWFPVFDDQSISSVGAIAVAESDPNVVYVGTGERCPRGNISHGDGIYKSVDAGKSWKNIGLVESRYVGKILVHPRDENLVYVAALGHLYAPPGEFRGDNGVFRSKDGGMTWDKILESENNVTGAVDMVFDPSNPRIIFASLWEIYRTPWSMSSGGPGSGLYRSRDGGDTWERLQGNGLPDGIMGRIGVAVSPANPEVVYTIIENKDGGVFRSDNGGDTWRKVNSDSNLRQRAWYYTHLYADPVNVDKIYCLNVRMHTSKDGGRTWTASNPPHGDNHDLWIDPLDPDRMINGNDGGGNVSTDGGLTWTESKHPTAQFYHTYTDDEFPYNVYGAQQDNSTIKIKSQSNDGAITENDWYAVGGGESGHIIPDPRNHNIVYAGSYGGNLTRYDHRIENSQNIQVWPDNPMGWAAGDLKFRFQWTAPIMISKHNPAELYHSANVLFRSMNEGKSWEQVSPDLTRNDPEKLGPSGGPLTHDNTSVEYYCTIFALMESPLRHGLIWVGTDDGLVHITRDNCETWTEITPKQLPEWSLISSIEPSHFKEGKAYIAVDRHELDDHKAYAYKTEDYGRSWKPINKGFRENDFLRVIREDPVVEGILYAGTETGIYYSIDDGESWHSLQLNLPTSPVHDLSVKQNDLVAGTHGRSFWILDDLTVIHQLRDMKMNGNRLLVPAPAYIGPGGGGFRGAASGAGANPPSGVIVNYFLNEEPESEITLEFLDENGSLIKKFSNMDRGRQGISAIKGMNQFIWNTRYDDAVIVPGSPLWAGRTAGPAAPPGDYTVRLTDNGRAISADFEIKIDPRINTTVQELRAQFELLVKIRDKVTLAHETVLSIRQIKSDLGEYRSRLKDNTSAKDVVELIESTVKELSDIEGKILQVRSRSNQDPLNYPIMINNRLAALTGVVSNSFYAPTKQAYDVFDMLSGLLHVEVERYGNVINTQIRRLNERIRALNLPAIMIKKSGEN
ncbi:WD40/YVTN/BNR-like repeat-containing protein [candidate division KSB1 bacterium]